MNDRNQLLLVLLHLALERAVARSPCCRRTRCCRILTFGPSVHREGQVHQLGPARHLLDLVRDLANWNPFSFIMSRTMPSTFFTSAGIDERVEADLGVGLLQRLVDLGRLDLLRAGVVDDLDALTFFDVVDDQLAHHAVRERVVLHLDRDVVEEVGAPQPLEVFADRLLGRLVVRDPDALGRPARLQLNVVEVGLLARRARCCPAPRSTERSDR